MVTNDVYVDVVSIKRRSYGVGKDTNALRINWECIWNAVNAGVEGCPNVEVTCNGVPRCWQMV
jgi:hypothetical protein